jgi:predicted dehydrogenase
MNGVTGRMGANQHLIRSILAIRHGGGVPTASGLRIWPEPLLVGRNEAKLRALAERHGLERWSTDLDEALADPDSEVYFDAAATLARPAGMERAIGAGMHVYCEKPSAPDVESALRLAQLARDAGVKHGVVQDKLFLPGLLKLRRLVDSGFFGRILSVRGEFGYWVYEGPEPPAQRPSWNYRKEDGGGILADMLPHWRYVLDDLFGAVRTVYTLGVTHIPERVDEAGRLYESTAEDAAYATFELEGGIVAQLNSSWCVRVDRDELVEFQVDGTDGSAVAGLRRCRVQPRDATRTSRTRTTTARAGWSCPTRPTTTTASRSSGRCSCATWPATSPSPGTCSRGRRESSSPSWPNARGGSGGCSRCRSWTHERRRGRRAAAAGSRWLARAVPPG